MQIGGGKDKNVMSIQKTRQKLVDIARQLFAKKGIEGTTMNDVAVASGKGRRTLYTYFNSKEELYYAVIEGELERLSDKLDEVAAKKTKPLDKIIELIYTHLSMIKETVVRKDARLSYIIADKNVEIMAGRTLMGHATYPIVLAKGSKV